MRATHTALFLALATFLSIAPHLYAQRPANDKFTNRTILTGTNLVVTGSNTNATKENGEPNHAGNVGGKSVWWAWTAPTNGELTITTDGSAHADNSPLDTLLGVYTGSSVSSLSVVASNDDHGVFVTSRVRFEAAAAAQYQIAVDGYNYDTNGVATNADSGNISLSLTFVSEPILRPVNDSFANSTVLAGVPVLATGQNVEATREPGEPLHAGKYGDTSVWWTWTAPANDAVLISTDGSTFDTMLAVYTGSVLSNLTAIASNDDEDPDNGILTSAVVFNTVAGQAYRIAVDGFDGAWGQITLNIGSAVPRLSGPLLRPDGAFQFTVSGLAGKVYEIDSSPDCGTWTLLGMQTNATAATVFVDSTATNFAARFYRAVLRP